MIHYAWDVLKASCGTLECTSGGLLFPRVSVDILDAKGLFKWGMLPSEWSRTLASCEEKWSAAKNAKRAPERGLCSFARTIARCLLQLDKQIFAKMTRCGEGVSEDGQQLFLMLAAQCELIIFYAKLLNVITEEDSGGACAWLVRNVKYARVLGDCPGPLKRAYWVALAQLQYQVLALCLLRGQAYSLEELDGVAALVSASSAGLTFNALDKHAALEGDMVLCPEGIRAFSPDDPAYFAYRHGAEGVYYCAVDVLCAALMDRARAETNACDWRLICRFVRSVDEVRLSMVGADVLSRSVEPLDAWK